MSNHAPYIGYARSDSRLSGTSFLWRWSLLLFALLWLGLAPAMAGAAQVTLLKVDGAIGPASSDYIIRGLAHAAAAESELLVLQMDTPGGLDTSMRDIIKAIVAAPLPVATYVAPSGARAASAGTYILYASHIAAMAPGTNLGAATPVQLGGLPDNLEPKKPKDDKAGEAGEPTRSNQQKLTDKQVNDAAAYIRSLAQMRGRNVQWGELAVKQAASLSAAEALELKVVDVIATDVSDLLRQIDGKQIKLAAQQRILSTENASIVEYAPDWRVTFLGVITNPSVALLLMMIGFYGLFFEFSNPGLGGPGIIGAICLLVGLYALQLLPLNYAGAALILLGLGFMVAEAYIGSFGLLGIGGIIAFVIGAIILIDTDLPAFGVSLPFITLIATCSALVIAAIGSLAMRAHKLPRVSGAEELIGATGALLEDTDSEGWAMVHGEQWRVRASTPLRRGQAIQVVARTDLVLDVIPVNTES